MNILVTAEMFGYGPIVTAIHLVESLRRKIDTNWIFMGSGIAMEQAKKSGLFNEYVICDTFDEKELEKQKEYFIHSDCVISSENLQGAIYCVKNAHKVYYIDNLFWLWDEIPNELDKVQCYFIVDCFHANENIKRIGQNILRYELVGPLRKNVSIEPVREDNKVIINIGGADSFLSNFELVSRFYSIIIDIITEKSKERGIDEIVVCGGEEMVCFLKQGYENDKSIRFESFSPEEYLSEIQTAKRVFVSPGLGNFFESLNMSIPVMLLPPINYSQYWQIEEYKQLDLDIFMANWNDFHCYSEVERYVKEEVGVNQVLKNLQQFIEEESLWTEYQSKIDAFYDFKEFNIVSRKETLKKFKQNGIETIANVIYKEMAVC